MACGNRYPGANQYGNMQCVPYGYQGKNTLVKIKLGFTSPVPKINDFQHGTVGTPTTTATNEHVGGISILSVNLRGYGNINYGSTVTGSSDMEAPSPPSGHPIDQDYWLVSRGNGVPLFIREYTELPSGAGGWPNINYSFASTGKVCPGLCLQIPCGVNSFEVVAMVWNLYTEDPPSATESTDIVNAKASWATWVAVWHVDLAKCCVTAVSWTRVLNENRSESCTTHADLHDGYISVNNTKHMNSTLSKCCCSCTSNCCTKTTCSSDLDATNCDNSECTNVLTLFSASCEPCCSTNNKSCC